MSGIRRIAVITSSPPLVDGGHMTIARALVRALREAGYQADVLVTPQNRFGRQGAAYLATWLTDVRMSGAERIDRVITLRYPAYAVRHPDQVCWLNHTMREYYDLWGRFSARLSPQGRVKEQCRRAAIHAADRYLLKHHVSKLFMLSGTVQRRYAMWPELQSSVLYAPAPQRPYRCDGYGDYVFMVSRLTPLKRADLVLRALATPHAAGVRAVIAGEGEEYPRLVALARELGIDSRVTITGGLTESALLDHLARCRAVVFPPFDEDYGFVTVEAFASSKAVITCRDSGGPAELVAHETNGLVVDPSPEALGSAIGRVMSDAALAETLGTAARAAGDRLTWADTVARLTVD